MIGGDDLVASEWAYVLGFLPKDFARSAWAQGALLRRRQVDSASDLLRLALGYALCDWSLARTAAAAEGMGMGHLSDVAVLKRLRRCGSWLEHLTSQLLRQRAAVGALPTLRLRLGDATTVSRPGSQGADWRIHACYDAGRGCFDQFVLTDATGGESLRRYPLRPGDVLVADRGYAHLDALTAVGAVPAHFVVRTPWNRFAFQTEAGEAWDLLTFLRRLPDAQVAEAFVQAVADGGGVGARLVALRKSPAAAEVARRRILREAKRKGKTPDARTLECAGYFFVLTTLPSEITADQVLTIYRLRWQIEMAFKRLKSLLRLDALRARDPALARSYLYGKLIGALLLDELTARAQAFSPWGYEVRPTDL
jgi:hypothetical protein